jgi:hypothetical protein
MGYKLISYSNVLALIDTKTPPCKDMELYYENGEIRGFGYWNSQRKDDTWCWKVEAITSNGDNSSVPTIMTTVKELKTMYYRKLVADQIGFLRNEMSKDFRYRDTDRNFAAYGYELRSESEYKFTEEDIMAAAQYGMRYALNSMHDGHAVPKGNVLQWLHNTLELPSEGVNCYAESGTIANTMIITKIF